MKKILSVSLLLVIVMRCICHAQGAEQLTNAKIISMVKGGLPKAAIVKSIENKPGNFDTSTQALPTLKKQGVHSVLIKNHLSL